MKGSCLCGQINYEITGDVGDIVHCHCTTCRKAHASAFSSVAAVQDPSFKLLTKNSLKSYESSPGKHRFFCSNCGSQIYAKRDNTEHIILRLGCLDDELQSAQKSHIWLSQKASWYGLNAKLAMHDEFE